MTKCKGKIFNSQLKLIIMIKVVLLLLQVTIISCYTQIDKKNSNSGLSKGAENTKNYKWSKLLDSAQWQKSYNFQLFEMHDTLWIIHHNNTWFSADGLKWSESKLDNKVNNQAFLDYVKFRDAIYGLGYFEGNIEKYNFKNEIYKTSGLITWEILSKNSNLPNRFFYHPFVFQNKIWIIGGEDKTTKYSDIWNSEDGIHWVKQKDNLPFGKRNHSQIVYHRDKLFLLNNDVWSSIDGLNWIKEKDEILEGETILGYTAVVFDNKIWLLGCNRNGQFQSQVFVSEDGKEWKGQEAPWSPRGGVAATVFKDKIYMTGGKYGGLEKNGSTTEFIYSNDLWVLEKK